MRRNNNYTLERFSPYGIRVHTEDVLSDLYASTFVRDMTNYFSILLSQSVDHHGFYTIEAKDDKLKELLSIDEEQMPLFIATIEKLKQKKQEDQEKFLRFR